MKKRILAILFALTLAATMLPAGLAVSAAADENLLVNGSFEIAAEEGDVEFGATGAKGWLQKQRALGARLVYDENAEGAVAPLAGTGDAYFAVTKDRTSPYNDFLYQSFKLVAGKKYTASYLVKATGYPLNSGIKLNATEPTAIDNCEVQMTINMGETAATDWRRVSATFVVPGEAGTEVDAVFIFQRYDSTGTTSETPDGYIDDARVVEAENQETILYTVNGFDNYVGTSTSNNKFDLPAFTFAGETNGWADGAYTYSVNRIREYDNLYFPTHADGNRVMRFSSIESGNVSNIKLSLSAIDFAGKGVTVGTPLRLSFKARLVDIPDALDTTANPTFGEYTMQGTFKAGLMGPYVVGSDNSAPALTAAGGSSPEEGTTVYLQYPGLTSYGMKDLALSTKNVNEQDKNANEWVQYDFIFPYQDNLTHLAFFSGHLRIRFTGSVAAGYSWEMDDLELSIADTGVLPSGGNLEEEHTYKMLNNSSIKVTKAYANADGTGTEYTFAGDGYQDALKTEFPFPCYTTQLDANKNVKAYQKTDTAVGAAYLAADDATGASLVTAVYKIDGDIRKLVGVGVNAAEAGFVAAPEVALAGITAEAGTYEVKTYIWKIGTLAAQGSSTIVKVAAE